VATNIVPRGLRNSAAQNPSGGASRSGRLALALDENALAGTGKLMSGLSGGYPGAYH
jgi:hypothetical protein